MKFFCTTILIFAFSTISLAQSAPNGFNFQGIARDNGDIITGRIGIQLSIRQGNPNGNIVYQERQSPNTNQYGVFSIEVGGTEATAISGSLANINWQNGPFFIQSELDPRGGVSYNDLGTTQLLSVPYALYSETASTALDDRDRDSGNELQSLSIDGNNLILSNGGGAVTLPSNGTSVWSANTNDIYYDSGNVGIGTDSPSHTLHVQGGNSSLRLEGTQLFGSGARLNFGDGEFVFIEEDSDDNLTIQADRFRLVSSNHNFDTDAGAGSYRAIGSNGLGNIRLSSLTSNSNHGFISVQNSTGGTRAAMFVNGDGGGAIEVSDPIGFTRGRMRLLPSGEGFISLQGPNGNDNIALSSLSGNSNNGFITVNDSNGDTQAGIFVNSSGQGIVFGDQKNFRVQHPYDSDKEIWYGSLEGPELAAYHRGTGELVNGEAHIIFPEHYRIISNTETMTILLSPLSADSKGLAIIEKNNQSFKIKELFEGKGNYKFDWEVKCVRNGYESFEAIRSKNQKLSENKVKSLDKGHPASN